MRPNLPHDKDAEHEFVILAIAIAGLGVLIAIAFQSTNPLLIIRTTLALAWLFLLPGYVLTLAWRSYLTIAERIGIGVAIQAALLGMLSYVAGIAGWNAQTHGTILPAISIVAGIGLEMLHHHRSQRAAHMRHGDTP